MPLAWSLDQLPVQRSCPGTPEHCSLKRSKASLSVQEVTHAGKDHGHTQAVGGGYDVIIAD
jgi:hypothetical protein